MVGKRIRCTLGALIFISGDTAFAQDGGTAQEGAGQDGADVSRVVSQRLDAISVTATRNPIKAFEYPGMISVIGQEEIYTRQASSPDDVLKLVPNVEFSGGPRRTGEVPSIRGFSGPDLIILFDGARQSFNSAHDGRFFIDPALLKQVEVIRGPASSLYGSGGNGGLISFQTADAADFLLSGSRYGARVGGGYQTVNGEPSATLSVYGRPTDTLDLIASVAARSSGDIDLGDGSTLTNTDDEVLAGFAKGTFDFADHHQLEASFITFRNDAEEPNNGQGLGGTDRVQKEIRSDTVQAAYSYRDPGNRFIDLDIVGYFARNQSDEVPLTGTSNIGLLLERDVDTLGFRLDNRTRANLADDLGVTFTYGGEFISDTQDGSVSGGPRDGVPDAEARNMGAFVQAEVALSDAFGVIPGDFLIIPGIRYDSYETTSSIAADNSESAVSPKVGISYLPNDWLLFFANYAHAFRAPTFDELYLVGTHFEIPIGPGVVNRFVPNANLRPQKTRTFEFGGGVTFTGVGLPSGRLEVKASRFVVWGEDFIDLSVNQPTLFVDCNPFIPGNCDGTTNSANVPNAKLWGNEVELAYETDRFLIALGYATLDGENQDTGAKLGVLTPDQFTLNAALKVPEYDSLIGWRLIAADKFDKVNSAADARSGYAVSDIYFAWQPHDGVLNGFRLDLGIDNVFDKAYSRIDTNVNEAERNFKAFVSYSINLKNKGRWPICQLAAW